MARPDTPIPDAPGAYLFRDAEGRVLYVGKAKSLRSRLGNYFGAGVGPRTAAMVEAADSVEWVLANGEVEALMLEYSLIKEHRPRFNVRLRDDKSYPYLAVTLDQHWPRPMVVRGRKRKGVRYFGPYAHAYAIRDTLDLLLRTFPVRTCSDGKFERHERLGRPCLYFHIERCAGPCVGAIDKAAYDRLVVELVEFLDGRHAPVTDRLDKEMHAAAEALEFERAARVRDQLDLVRKAIARQQAVTDPREDVDVVGIAEDDLEAAVQVFFVRGGRITGRRGFVVDKVADLAPDELVGEILLDLYGDADDVPRTVLVPTEPAGVESLEALLTQRRTVVAGTVALPPDTGIALTTGDPGTANYPATRRRGGRVRVRVPQRGERRRLLDTVTRNARQAFTTHRMKRHGDHNARARALTDLQAQLGLPEAPLRIECFDVSQVQGAQPVASMVVFEDGTAKKSDYRRFAIKTVAGQDDFAMMREALTRRFAAYLSEREEGAKGSGRFSYAPGLLLVDGGKGQLNVAVDVLESLGLHAAIPVAGLAKRFEDVFVPGQADPVVLPRGADSLYLLQAVRDEAHRFAVSYHRGRRSKAMVASVLDDVPGLGPQRRRALLGRFGSVKRIRAASPEEIAATPGLPATVAAAVHERLQRP